MRGGLLAVKSCILAGLLSISGLHAVLAQTPEPVIESQAAGRDAPGRVARLSYVDGTVSLAPAGTEEWAEAVLNRPLTDGDRVWVENGSRAELQMGSSTVHLDQSTGFSFVELSDDAMLMNLTEGAIVVHVRRKLQDERIEIDTPNTVISLLHPGEYHIQVSAAGDETTVRTRTGESEVASERNTYRVRQGEQGVFKGMGELAADIRRLDSRTAFENWANDRERAAAQAASSRYVSRDVIGYEDLDRHGEWVHEPEYGYVWRPIHVHSTWAPYRDGRWVWIAPWGWTWVDAAPWGFAPFHYGRWAYVRSRWCWVPGPIHVRPVYAPALVAWVGGPHVSVSVSLGPTIGWYPLGPREIFVPGYWHSRHYIHRLNHSHTIIVNNIYIDRIYAGRRHGDYRYRRFPHAITAVHRDSFVSGGPLRGRLVQVNERALREWRHDPRAPAIVPDRNSVLAGRRIEDRSLARVVQRDREITARRAMPTRVSFDAERRAVEANGGRPLDRARLFDQSGRADLVRRAEERRDLRSQGREIATGGASPSTDRRSSSRAGVQREALSDRPQRSGGTVQQWRNRENAKETTQPRMQGRDSIPMNSLAPPRSDATTTPRSNILRGAEPAERDRSSRRAEERQRTPGGAIVNERRRGTSTQPAPQPQRFHAPQPQRYQAPQPQRFQAPQPERRIESTRSREPSRPAAPPVHRESGRAERSTSQPSIQHSALRHNVNSGNSGSSARQSHGDRGQSRSRGGARDR